MANNFQEDIGKIIQAIEQLYNISIKKKQTMPTASSNYANQIVLYIGETNNDYVKNTFYRCEDNGINYVWTIAGLTGVKVDGTAQTITDGYVNLHTINSNYNPSTNRLATFKDVSAIQRLDNISYYGKNVEPTPNEFNFQYVRDQGYIVTGFTGIPVPEVYVVPYQYNDGNNGEYVVFAIDDDAFKNETNLYNLTLPNTIVSIGNNAFDGCSNLSAITIPDSVVDIGNDVFDNTASEFKVYCGKGSAMATYCETNNIPYITNVDSKDIPHWKLLGSSEITSGISDAIAVTVSETSFFTNTNYKKFKIVFDIATIDTYTNNYFFPRIYFQKETALGYRLFNTSSTSTGAVYRIANTQTFSGMLIVERQPNDINKCSTILLPSQKDNGSSGTAIYGAGNNGIYENGATALTLNRVAIVYSGSPPYYIMTEGSKAWIYAWEE